MKVLYVDDDWKLAGDMRVLMPPEIGLIWVPDSKAAVDFLYKGDLPDAIILDLCLPAFLSELNETEGLRLLDLMRNMLAEDVPVVVLSQFPRDEAEEACLKHGANAYMEKPCAVNDLVDLLIRLVRES